MPDYPILEIKNLSVSFKTDNSILTAVNNISFSLEKGKTLGIVGESGSGKSVTSLSIMQLVDCPPGKIASGNILFSDEDVKQTDLLKLPEKEIKKYRGNKIGMIFQEPMTSLNPVYKCGKQISESILQHQKISHKKAKQKSIDLLTELQLPRPEDIYNSYPHQLSGGQKQRVMIAMAICCNPSVLIADEPTTALDVTVQKSILQLIKALQKKHGMSVIFITHDLGVIAEIADKLLIMYNGKIVERGDVKEIFQHPKHPYTKGLLACRPPMDVRLKKLPVIKDFLNEKDKISVEAFTKKLIISDEQRKAEQQSLFEKTPLLKLRNVKTYFPVKSGLLRKTKSIVKAVDDVSFDVYPSETLGLVGESGCGKTTLGRTILNLIDASEGEIIYKNRNISQLSKIELRKLRKDIQIIFQDPYSSLNPRMTAGSAIMEPLKAHNIYKNYKERKEKVFDLLKKVGLEKAHYYRYPHEFSGGQRQRICIARALSLNPEFIICDESVSALDVSIQAQVLNLLNDLKKEFGFTYIFISHDLSVVKFMSDRMMVMKDGKIQEIGDADEIYYHPKTEYTKQLIDAIPKGEF